MSSHVNRSMRKKRRTWLVAEGRRTPAEMDSRHFSDGFQTRGRHPNPHEARREAVALIEKEFEMNPVESPPEDKPVHMSEVERTVAKVSEELGEKEGSYLTDIILDDPPVFLNYVPDHHQTGLAIGYVETDDQYAKVEDKRRYDDLADALGELGLEVVRHNPGGVGDE